MAFFQSESTIGQLALILLIIAVLLLSTIALILAIKFRIKSWRGDFEENVSSDEGLHENDH